MSSCQLPSTTLKPISPETFLPLGSLTVAAPPSSVNALLVMPRVTEIASSPKTPSATSMSESPTVPCALTPTCSTGGVPSVNGPIEMKLSGPARFASTVADSNSPLILNAPWSLSVRVVPV